MRISHLTKTGIMFSSPKLSREWNKLLQWETYNPFPKLNNNSLRIIKIAFYAFWKQFGWKTRSSKQLKIAVLNRQRRRFRAENNVFSAKVSELSEWHIAITDQKETLYLEIVLLTKKGITFSALKLSRWAK